MKLAWYGISDCWSYAKMADFVSLSVDAVTASSDFHTFCFRAHPLHMQLYYMLVLLTVSHKWACSLHMCEHWLKKK